MAGSKLWGIFVALTLLLMRSGPTSGAVTSGGAIGAKVPYAPDIHYDYPVGDPRRCVQQARQTKMDINRFEVLPGVGWDNLRNVEMGQVVSYNYSQCRVTDDGRFLIPDNVNALPVKSSYVETFAEMISHYINSTSTTCTTINAEAGLSLVKFAASGSYSREHQQIKSKQIEDKSITTRVQLRYHRYDAHLEPDPKLHPLFKNRILNIAGHLLLNNTEQALYQGQLIVRDYGTHVQTTVTAGAGLVKTDFLRSSQVNTEDDDKTKILAQASASFFHVFHMGGSYAHTTEKDVITKYNKSMTHSFVTTHGGGLLGANTSLDTWMREVDTNLVAMDRAGDPLNFLITARLFPELPAPTLAALEKVIRTSIELYYDMNTVRGCTQMKSPNFSPAANFDDGTCKSKPTNYTFGGVYQTCTVSGRYISHNPCANMIQPNPMTGGPSCPSGYTSVKMYTGTRTSPTESQHSCHRCWLVAHCCHTDQFRATATYNTYWCAATESVATDSGYMFGGLYTTHAENPVTGAHTCPENFYAMNIFTDLHVCVSDEYEWAIGVPFAGLFSCREGNPLAVPGVHPVSATNAKADQSHSLRSFMARSNAGHTANHWPQRCPEGYSQHMAVVEQGCAVHYCVKSGALSGPVLPRIKRPPFSVAPPALIEDKDNLVMFDLQDQTWLRDEAAYQALHNLSPAKENIERNQGNSGDGHGLGPGPVAGIAVAALIVGAVVGYAAIVLVRRRQQTGRQSYHRITSQESSEHQSLFGDSRQRAATAQTILSQSETSPVSSAAV